jgi:uncharacterized protein (DUF608 family)
VVLLIKLMMHGQSLVQGNFTLDRIIIAHNLIFSAYCGGLHVAALRACVEMARIMNDSDAIEEYETWLTLAKKSYSEKLWNGKYYNYDSSRSNHHDSIMADQLAGFWYLRLCGHEYEVGLIEYFFVYFIFIVYSRILRKIE